MDDTLIRKQGESELNYIKRIVTGKLIDKTIDADYTELAPLIFGQQLNSSECRKRMYGIKRLLEVTENTLTTLNYEKDGYEQTKCYRETIEINKDGSFTSDKLIGIEDESQLKDEAFLLKVHNYDPRLWQIVTARNSIWNAQRKGGDIIKMYASKITVKPRTNSISLQELEEHFQKLSKEYAPAKKYRISFDELKVTNKILEIPVVDLHFGKKAYTFEVGEDIDTDIIEKRFLGVINDIIDRVKTQNFEKIIFPIGNDFFNSDTIENTTTRGTRQDNDLRWQEMFLKGVELLIKAIDKLSLLAPVEVFYVAGNHDKMASYYATHYLNAWYRNDDRVLVSIDPQIRKYIEYGNCLIGFSHGNEEGKRIGGLMQVEASSAWGRTKFREWHLGHLHHETSKEDNGVIIRGLSTIAGTDAWHYESGYVGAVKKQQAFIWDKDKGLTDILISVATE